MIANLIILVFATFVAVLLLRAIFGDPDRMLARLGRVTWLTAALLVATFLSDHLMDR